MNNKTLHNRSAAMFQELAKDGGLFDYGPNLSRLLIRVMRALAAGRPVSKDQVDRIIADLGIARGDAHQFLSEITERDAEGSITGILGLSLNNTIHGFYVNGVRLSAWCAADTLILPAMLDQSATIESKSPVSGEKIRLRVSPQRVEEVSPSSAVLSMVIVAPNRTDMSSVESIWSTFCHHIYFFGSRKEAEQWAAGRDDIEILTVGESFEIVRQLGSRLLRYWQGDNPMAQKNTPTVDQYWKALDAAVPAFSPEEQRAAVPLLRELAKGQPVDAAQLGRALGVAADEARAFLNRESIKAFVAPDGDGRLQGFFGLSVAPMHHRLEVDDRTLWTWCAWDTIFMPEILGKRARVVSPDPETGEPVQLVVTPQEIESAEPGNAVVSFLLPDADDFVNSANVITKFCHFIFFFASRASGERWVAKHPGTFLYSLDEAFALARRLNARNFGSELARRAPAPTRST